MSGTGKSLVLAELARRGHSVVDTDYGYRGEDRTLPGGISSRSFVSARKHAAPDGYETGTSVRACAGTCVHRRKLKKCWFPARTCPCVPAGWTRVPYLSFPRNERVPGSSPGVGFLAERSKSDPWTLRERGRTTR